MLAFRLLKSKPTSLLGGFAAARPFSATPEQIPSNLILEGSRIREDNLPKYTPVDLSKPESFTRPVLSLFGTKAESAPSQIQLEPKVFGAPLRVDIVHDVVRFQRALRRQGTASAKTRSEVSGGGRKPFKQKGTGRARQGSTRSPHIRGGGVAHPPKPRDFSISMNKKVRSMALRVVLSAKLREGKLSIVDSASLETPRTRTIVDVINDQKWKSCMIIDEYKDRNMALSIRGLHNVSLTSHLRVSVYELLRHEKLLITPAAIELLQRRLQGEKMGVPQSDRLVHQLKELEIEESKKA